MMGNGNPLDTLFDKWELDCRSEFQRDGIVDEEKYRAAPWKILFLSKEANNIIEDMREQARDAARRLVRFGTHGYAYWRTLARWSYAILNGFAPFNLVKQNYADSAALLRVAIMNLKKTPGGGKARPKQIEEFATQNRDYIIREIEMVSPQIIICGGVGRVLKGVVNSSESWLKTSNDLKYFHWQGTPVLDYYHPAYHFLPASTLDPPLVRATKELLLPRELCK
jgi:hypothetical protein